MAVRKTINKEKVPSSLFRDDFINDIANEVYYLVLVLSVITILLVDTTVNDVGDAVRSHHVDASSFCSHDSRVVSRLAETSKNGYFFVRVYNAYFDSRDVISLCLIDFKELYQVIDDDD